MLYVSLDSNVTERETYNILEFLGDIGGLLDAFYYSLQFILAPLLSFQLKNDLLS